MDPTLTEVLKAASYPNKAQLMKFRFTTTGAISFHLILKYQHAINLISVAKLCE